MPASSNKARRIPFLPPDRLVKENRLERSNSQLAHGAGDPQAVDGTVEDPDIVDHHLLPALPHHQSNLMLHQHLILPARGPPTHRRHLTQNALLTLIMKAHLHTTMAAADAVAAALADVAASPCADLSTSAL